MTCQMRNRKSEMRVHHVLALLGQPFLLGSARGLPLGNLLDGYSLRPHATVFFATTLADVTIHTGPRGFAQQN